MPPRRFASITVTDALYAEMKRRAKRQNKSVSRYASEFLEAIFCIEDRFSKYAPFLKLISLDNDEVVVRDNKKDRIVGVKAKAADNGKVRFYCELDDTDYCPHTAFAAA
jgi:hypothetical protein